MENWKKKAVELIGAKRLVDPYMIFLLPAEAIEGKLFFYDGLQLFLALLCNILGRKQIFHFC